MWSAPHESALDQPLDRVAQRRGRNAGGRRDRRRGDRLVVADVRDEGELRRCDPGLLELAFEDLDDVLTRRRNPEQQSVVPGHSASVADSAAAQ